MAECMVKEDCVTWREKRGVCRKCLSNHHANFESIIKAARRKKGRSNKRSGKKSEQKLLLHFKRQGFEARIIDGSGAYKKSREDADSDLRVTLYGVERKIENKKYTSKASALAKINSLIGEYGILKITGFCYVMNENVFYRLAKGEVDPLTKIKEVSDRNYGWIHHFFEQDYADIVSLDESYKDFVFCLQPSLYKELIDNANF